MLNRGGIYEIRQQRLHLIIRKPDGLTIVHPDKLQAFLKPLEVERIPGVGTKTERILKLEMGIKSIGEFS